MIRLWWKRRQLRKNGFCIVRNFFDKNTLNLYKSFMDLTHLYELRRDETSYVLHGKVDEITKNPFDDAILLAYQSQVEKYFNRDMIPSYIFTREYYEGASLDIHTDREQCQYSVSVTIYKPAGVNSQLVFCDDKDGTNPVVVDMEEGDAIIFNGASAYGGKNHYRPPVIGGNCVTAFLHYVDIDNGTTAQEPFPMPGYRK